MVSQSLGYEEYVLHKFYQQDQVSAQTFKVDCYII